ncbi:hypothetical protein ES705_26109 [subsurface metagenome]
MINFYHIKYRGNEVRIKGGYYLKARCIQNSEIATMPPYVREIWDWLLKEANHTNNKVNGTVIERGQLIRTFKDIQEGLYWMVGWRKMKYKKWQCENAMKFLRERSMITTMKTTRGMLVTICNYSLYQDPKNYESNRKADRRATVNKQTTDTINKNDNELNNDKKKECKREYMDAVFLTKDEYKKLTEEIGEKLTQEYIKDLSLYIRSKGKKYKSHYATILTWHRKDIKEGKNRLNKGKTIKQLAEEDNFDWDKALGKGDD